MLTRYLFPLVLFPWCLFGQTPFLRITDPNNPAVTFPGNAAPYKGVAWIDLDGDNRTDLFVSQRYLFHNDGDGHFTQLTNVNGAQGGQGAAGSSWGDLDNDGDLDGITTSVNAGFHQNNGDNTFTLLNADIPDFAGYSAWDCALADADNNGRLDAAFVHACCSFHPTGPFPCKLYLQSPEGNFTSVTGYEFTDTTAAYTIPVWYDYDLDGDMDLFIGSGPANGTPKPDFNYRNLLKETGTFALERLTTFPFLEPQDGQTYNFIDYDNDGDLDICLTNYAAAPNRLYRNDGGTYTSINTPFTQVGQHLANCWGDVNNDGYLDVLITADGTSAVNLYYNQKDGSFANATVAGTAGANVCGIALADYDNDGKLDFYTNGANEARGLFHNQLTSNQHWVQFSLQGTTSNRSAIGAEIRVKATLDGVAVWQLRQVVAHNSFQSQNDLRQHFGLNDALQIDSITVRWPSGLLETFGGLATNGFYKIVEGQGITMITGIAEPTLTSRKLQINPNPTHGDFQIASMESAAGKVTAVEVFDSTGRVFPCTMSGQGERVQVRFAKAIPVGVYQVRAHFSDGTMGIGSVIRQ